MRPLASKCAHNSGHKLREETINYPAISVRLGKGTKGRGTYGTMHGARDKMRENL